MAEKNNILVVEDNDFVRMQIVNFLQEEGFNVIEASDGRVAFEEVEKVVMAIVDVRMEPIDGFEFLRSIRSDDITIPVILVTGDQNPDLLSEAAKWGVAAVLMKPVQRERLVKTVEKTMKTMVRASW